MSFNLLELSVMLFIINLLIFILGVLGGEFYVSSGLSKLTLNDQHRITITKKTILFFYCDPVGFHNVFITGKS